MAIRAALIFNNHGKPRLTRFYSQLSISRQQALIQRIFALVHRRTEGNNGREVCNFLDAPELRPLLPPAAKAAREDLEGKQRGSRKTATGEEKEIATTSTTSSSSTDQVRVIYRHYATLFFVFVVDESESELGILDLIQVFVESLDRCFENVCELDLIFHFDEVHAILNEIIQGGLVLETNISEIVAAVQTVSKATKASLNSAALPISASGPGSALEGMNSGSNMTGWTPPAGLGGMPWGDAAANVGEWARSWGGRRFGR